MASSSETRLSLDAKDHDDDVGTVRLVSEDESLERNLAEDDSDNLKDEEAATPVNPLSADAAQILPLLQNLAQGLSEPLIAMILRETLNCLINHTHIYGTSHGDVKVENIFFTPQGGIKLQHSGVKSQNQDEDILMVGILALHLAHGPAPFATFSPIELLLLTVRNKFALDSTKSFSKPFRSFLATCLLEKKVPKAPELLSCSFFKVACSTEHFIEFVQKTERVVKEKEHAIYIFALDANKENLSKERYLQAIPTWKADVQRFSALKVPDDVLDMWNVGGGQMQVLDDQKDKCGNDFVPPKDDKKLDEEQ